MKLTLSAYEYEFDGKVLCGRTRISVDTSGKSDIFNIRFIVDAIVNAQEEGRIDQEWIDTEIWESGKETDSKANELVDLTTLTFAVGFGCCKEGDNNFMASYIDVEVTPTNNEEFEQYFDVHLLQVYGKKIVNGVLKLPSWNIFSDDWELMNVGHSCTYVGYKESIGGYDGNGHGVQNEYCYVIRKGSLQNTLVNVAAPKSILSHLIGKGGKNIQELKDDLRKSGYRVNRINLISHDVDPFKKKSMF